jgi:hypothetical protein
MAYYFVVNPYVFGRGQYGMGDYVNVLMKSIRTLNSSTFGCCNHLGHALGACPIHELIEVSDLTTLDACPDIVPVYGPMVDALGFGLSHPSSPFSTNPIFRLSTQAAVKSS